MPVEVIMPKVDMDMTSGILSVWHVAEGDEVAKGAPLFDIETDKAAMEVESPASGRLHHISAPEGADVPVGQPVAWIYAEGEAVGPVPAGDNTQKPNPHEHVSDADAGEGAEVLTTDALAGAFPDVKEGNVRTPAGTFPGGSNAASARPRATPAARHAARQAGVALGVVSGSGPLGRVQRDDVTSHLDAHSERQPLAAPTGWTVEPGDLHLSRSKGGSGVPLLLIHGFGADSMGWQPLERTLGPDRPIWRIDLPCHGKSPRRRIDSFQSLARAVVDATDKLDLPQIHLVGHSLGGAVALALADIRPRRIASLTLIAPAGLGPETDCDALLGIARASRVESLLPWLKRLTATPDGISDEFARAAMRTRTDPQMRAAQIDMARALFPDEVQAFDLTAALHRVVAPARILWGRQDRIVPWRHGLQAPGAVALHIFQGLGHIPHIEDPEAIAAILNLHMAQAPTGR
jgi:pyruvate dehydrogenase E2 component (dihydrolipoamide acetyltransferase)